jgi:sugar phosphate isomerase/epimerase
MIPRILASTTSHKAEPLLPTLEVFARLGMRDVDLNLHHLLEIGTPVDAVKQAVAANGIRLWGLAGGWCDFFDAPPAIDRTFASVDRQVGIAQQLGLTLIRLFFGRLPYEDYSTTRCEAIGENLRSLSDRHPSMRFMFENHDGASSRPDVCREILETAGRPNIRMNFDPINFVRSGTDALKAARVLAPFVGHVHLKGLEHGEFCEFGVGDVDLKPVLDLLRTTGYLGQFSVEYEGPFDKTLRVYESVRRAKAAVGEYL